MRSFWLSLILCLSCVWPLRGQETAKVYTTDEVPNVYERDSTQFVSDPEGYFTPEERNQINSKLDTLNAHNGVQAVLVVVPAIPGNDELSFTTTLFEKWGIGNSEDDSGLLILFVTDPSYRTIRFEVGYGLEGVLTDYRSDRFIRQYLVPAALEGRAAEGFTEMLTEMDTLLQKEHEAFFPRDEERTFSNDSSFLTLLLWWVLVSLAYAGIIVLFYTFSQKKKGDSSVQAIKEVIGIRSGERYRFFLLLSVLLMPSAFILLPFFSRLERKNRLRVAGCPKCGTKGSVHQVHYPENTRYLTDAERTENKVGSKRYTILECDRCDYHDKIVAMVPNSRFSDCPRCGARTFHKKYTTRTSHAFVTDLYVCENCGHNERRHRRQSDSTPLITGSGSMGGFIGSGGFGGGSFGGGSFGGGASGGGGASVGF